MVHEFNEYVRECFSEAGEIVIKSMMGGYLVYFNGKLIGDVCGDELFLKRTPTSDRLLVDSELRYPYEESKTLMHVFDSFDDKSLIQELMQGMYAELPGIFWAKSSPRCPSCRECPLCNTPGRWRQKGCRRHSWCWCRLPGRIQ